MKKSLAKNRRSWLNIVTEKVGQKQQTPTRMQLIGESPGGSPRLGAVLPGIRSGAYIL
jgi:hypothetical protein